MELRELGDRLFRLHAKLIITFLLLGVLCGLALQLHYRAQYQASAVLVIGAPDPQSAEQAAALGNTAQGIATGPQLVSRAIAEAGVTRNANAVAAAISVQTLGSSGVITLTVTDRQPRAAIALANALAAGVVSTRATLIQSGLTASLRGLSQEEAATQAQIQDLSAQVPTAGTAEVPGLEARLASLQQAAAQIAVQKNTLQAQQGPKPAVLDKAVSAVGIHGRALVDALLGGLLGLVLGIAIAAMREMARPSLVGAGAISRAIGAPLLGEMSTLPDTWTLAALPDAGTYIELAAEAQNVQETRFAALEPDGRHRGKVRMLEGPLSRLRFGWSRTGQPLVTPADDDQSAELASAQVPGAPSAADPDSDAALRTGLVVATPRVLKAADVDAVTNFIWISGWSLLGVIVYSVPRKKITIHRSGPGPADTRHDGLTRQVEVDAW
jgi:capsular polysaccharide biosynthesis protein